MFHRLAGNLPHYFDPYHETSQAGDPEANSRASAGSDQASAVTVEGRCEAPPVVLNLRHGV